MVLMNLAANDAQISTSTDFVVIDATGFSQGNLKTRILCGRNCIDAWIQLDAANSSLSSDCYKIRGYDPSQWIPDLESLKQLERTPIFLDPNAWRGLQLNNDVLRPTGATDWVVVRAPSLPIGGNTHPVNLSQQPDHKRPWSRDEDNTLLTLRKQKKSLAEIALVLGRKELEVMCRYMDIVPLRSVAGGIRDPVPREVTSELLVYVIWVGVDTHPVDVRQRGWRIYGYHKIHCDLEIGS